MRWHVTVLCALLAAFCFRVLAQLTVALLPGVSFVPPFEVWHSGVLPYPLLVAAQLVIIAIYVWMILRIARSAPPRRNLGWFLVIFGGVYFGVMLARLFLGQTWLNHVHWFDRPVPSFFHLVLAGFLLVAGHYHLRRS